MASNNLTQQEILALFPDNVTHEISASDMRTFIDGTFADKEQTIVKVQYLANLAANNTTIYEGTIVIIWGDESAYNGLYLSKINQPTVVSDLVKLSGLIENPEDLKNPLFTYDHIANGVGTYNTATYVELLRLTTIPRVAGTYEVKLAMEYSYDNVNRSAYFQFSMDGGQNYNEIILENKDVNNKIPISTFNVDEFAGGIKDIIIEARCEDVVDTLEIFDMHIVYQRVK